MPARETPAFKDDLLALYREADALVATASCACADAVSAQDARCCQFAVTGREPYVTAAEVVLVKEAVRRGGQPAKRGRRLSLVQAGACPLLSPEGRCTIYAARPLGCRTFFCRGHEPPRAARAEVLRVSRAVASLSERWFPRDGRARPLTRVLGE
jgi:hypothetical protein